MSSTTSSSSAFAEAPADKSARKSALKPWQFYVTASFLAAAAAVWLSPPTTPVALLFMSLAIGAVGASAAALHAVLAALGGRAGREPIVTGSLRAELEREKLLTLRAIKDLQFDTAMGKISAADAAPMDARLRARAQAIMMELDSREQLRVRVERDLAARSGSRPQAPDSSRQTPGPEPGVRSLEPVSCASCATANDADARFCKNCGREL